MAFFLSESRFTAQNLNNEIDTSIIVEDTETRDNLGGTFIGQFAGETNNGENVSALGFSALKRNNGNDNTAIGFASGENNILGTRNTFIGPRSGINNLNGNQNIFIGCDCAQQNQNGSFNIYLGNNVAPQLINNNLNLIFGHFASFQSIPTLKESILIGHATQAEQDRHVVLGHNSFTAGTSNIIIGHTCDIEGVNNIVFGHDVNIRGSNIIVFQTKNQKQTVLQVPFIRNTDQTIYDFDDAFIVNDYLFVSPLSSFIKSSIISFSNHMSYFHIDEEKIELAVKQEENVCQILLSNNEIQISGNTKVFDDLQVLGTLVSKNIIFDNDITAENLTVRSTSVFNGSAIFNKTLEVNQNTFIYGDVWIDKEFKVQGKSTFLNEAFFKNDIHNNKSSFLSYVSLDTLDANIAVLSSNLTVQGMSTLHEIKSVNVDIDKLSTYKSATFNNDMYCSSNITCDQDISSRNLNCQKLKVQSSANFHGQSYFEDNVSCKSNLNVDRLSVLKSVEVKGNVNVQDNLHISGTLKSQTIHVQGPSSFEQNVLFKDKVDFDKVVGFHSTVNLFENININGTLYLHDSLNIGETILNETEFIMSNILNVSSELISIVVPQTHVMNIKINNDLEVNENVHFPFFEINSLKKLLETELEGSFKNKTRFHDDVLINQNQNNVFVCSPPAFFEKEVNLNESLNIVKKVNANELNTKTLNVLDNEQNLCFGVNKNQFLSRTDSIFFKPALFEDRVIFNNPVNVKNHALNCEKGILAGDNSVFENINANDIHGNVATFSLINCSNLNIRATLSNQHKSFLHSIICHNASVSNIQASYILANEGGFNDLYSDNAFFEYITIKQDAYIDHFYSSNVEISDAQIKDLFVDLAFIESINTKLVDIEEGSIGNIIIQASEIDHAEISNLEVNSVYSDQIISSKNFFDEVFIESNLFCKSGSINNLSVSNLQLDSLTLNDLFCSRGDFESLSVEDALISNVEVNDLFVNTLTVNDIVSLSNIFARTIESELVQCQECISSEISTSNLNVNINLNVEGSSTFKLLTTTNQLTCSNLKCDSIEIDSNLLVKEVKILESLEFTGSNASFLDRASFTHIKNVNFIDVGFDLKVGRYLQTNHKFLEIKFKEKALGDGEEDDIINLQSNTNWFILPFSHVNEQHGERGLTFNPITGSLRCQQSGIFVIDIYIEFVGSSQNDESDNNSFISLLLNENEIVSQDINPNQLKYIQKVNMEKKVIKTQFNSFINQDNFIFICLKSPKHFINFNRSYIVIYLLQAFL